MHVRIQGIRAGRQLTRGVMTSSSLGRCASGAERRGNIAFLGLSADAVVSVHAAHSIICPHAIPVILSRSALGH